MPLIYLLFNSFLLFTQKEMIKMKKKQVKNNAEKQVKSPLVSELRQIKKALQHEIKTRMTEIKLLTKELKKVDKDILKSKNTKKKVK